jgi:predicted O-linked N-acetylglucosamine transferase (SPINDLY family)
MDYMVADNVLVPAEHRAHYVEKMLYLPSYQVNDSQRPVIHTPRTRKELGLPESGFVFCCFNATFKITPDTFDSWMRILTRVEGSVLLLYSGSAAIDENFCKEAVRRGVAAERLVFGRRLPIPEYLARYLSADLFLDTLPYNAGTTASDALWMGVPVLTCLGETFAGRVAASVLNAVGLTELVTTTRLQYEDLAVDLATHPQRLAAMRQWLTDQKRETRLFDTPRFTRSLEEGYAAIHERSRAGLPPDHIFTAAT